MNDSPPLPKGTLLAGKFRIERLLGAGAMGRVYEVDHKITHHKRALKLLHPALCNVPDLVRRFLNEASAAGRVGNAHLVETFDAGTLPTGEPYLVMELLEGESLDAILKRERRLDATNAAEIVAQAAEGIDAAHQAGIIHRDLKPENLFVTARDGKPFVKILDFGVSKFVVSSTQPMGRTSAGMVYGSPAYMSPEQLSAIEVDPRADVFALGVVLFQSLTGVLPFDGPTLEALALRMLSGQLPPLETLRPDLHHDLAEVVRRALAPLRNDRVPTARALAEALAPFRGRAPMPLRWTHTLELGHAATIASIAPFGSQDSKIAPPNAPSLPPGVSRTRRAMLGITAVIGTILIAWATTHVVARARGPAVEGAVDHPPAKTSADNVGASILDPVSSATPTPATASPATPSSAGRCIETHKPATSSHVQPSAVGEHPSIARKIGLSEDNPFR
jgi:serine/threonine protein kinase